MRSAISLIFVQQLQVLFRKITYLHIHTRFVLNLIVALQQIRIRTNVSLILPHFSELLKPVPDLLYLAFRKESICGDFLIFIGERLEIVSYGNAPLQSEKNPRFPV